MRWRDGSLIRLDAGANGNVRYGMLETIREFAEEQLEESDEADLVRRRHANVMLDYTNRASRGLQSGARSDWAREVPAELDNVRAALRWSLDHDETDRALRIVGNLEWFWDALGRESEGLVWCREALAKDNVDQDSLAFAWATRAAGELGWNLGEFNQSREFLTRAVSRLRVLDERRLLGIALVDLALLNLSTGDSASAREQAREAVRILDLCQEPWISALSYFILGEVLYSDEPDSAWAAYQKSLAGFRAIGDPWGTAHALNGLGGMAMRARNYETARGLMEDGLAIHRSIDNRGAIAVSLASLGELARRNGDDAGAAAFLDEGLERFRALQDRERVAWAQFNRGLVALRRNQLRGAAEAFDECLALRAEQGNVEQAIKTVAAIARLAWQAGDREAAGRLWGAVEGIQRGEPLRNSPR